MTIVVTALERMNNGVISMIKLLEEIQSIGEEVQCEWCDSIIHCEEEDWKEITYYKWDKQRKNQFIDCPKCSCLIYRWEDRY